MHELTPVWLLRRRQVSDVHVSGRLIDCVRFSTLDGTDSTWASARTYLDCSYEGDLLAAAGVAFTVGREARDAFGEQHAGKLYVSQKQIPDGDATAALESLAVPFGHLVQNIEPETTGHADYALGLLYFLQHDEAVPQDVREQSQAYGLPRTSLRTTAMSPTGSTRAKPAA